jgi:hypothetical protein
MAAIPEGCVKGRHSGRLLLRRRGWQEESRAQQHALAVAQLLRPVHIDVHHQVALHAEFWLKIYVSVRSAQNKIVNSESKCLNTRVDVNASACTEKFCLHAPLGHRVALEARVFHSLKAVKSRLTITCCLCCRPPCRRGPRRPRAAPPRRPARPAQGCAGAAHPARPLPPPHPSAPAHKPRWRTVNDGQPGGSCTNGTRRLQRGHLKAVLVSAQVVWHCATRSPSLHRLRTPWTAVPGPVQVHLGSATTHAFAPPLCGCACARRPTACNAVAACSVAAIPARWPPCLQSPFASGKCSHSTARLVQRHGRAAVQVLAAALKARVLQDAQLEDDVPRPRPCLRLGLPRRAARPSSAPWQAGVTARSRLCMPSLSQRLCESAHARRKVTGGCQTPLTVYRVHRTACSGL